LAFGIVLLAIGGALYIVAANVVAEYQTPWGQVQRLLSEDARREYSRALIVQGVGAFVALLGLGAALYGAVAVTERYRGSSSQVLLPVSYVVGLPAAELTRHLVQSGLGRSCRRTH